jgi:hypothetical protein
MTSNGAGDQISKANLVSDSVNASSTVGSHDCLTKADGVSYCRESKAKAQTEV